MIGLNRIGQFRVVELWPLHSVCCSFAAGNDSLSFHFQQINPSLSHTIAHDVHYSTAAEYELGEQERQIDPPLPHANSFRLCSTGPKSILER